MSTPAATIGGCVISATSYSTWQAGLPAGFRIVAAQAKGGGGGRSPSGSNAAALRTKSLDRRAKCYVIRIYSEPRNRLTIELSPYRDSVILMYRRDALEYSPTNACMGHAKVGRERRVPKATPTCARRPATATQPGGGTSNREWVQEHL